MHVLSSIGKNVAQSKLVELELVVVVVVENI